MKSILTLSLFSTSLASLLLIVAGCSETPDTRPIATESEITSFDQWAEKTLNSTNIVEVSEWLKDHPDTVIGYFSVNMGEGTSSIASLSSRLQEAGAVRIVILPERKFFMGLAMADQMIVVLPSEAAAREKIFAIHRELVPLADPDFPEFKPNRVFVDRNQKYLGFSSPPVGLFD